MAWWDKPDADWRLEQTYALIHRLQPAALVGSNHHRTPFAGRRLPDVREGSARRKHRGIQRQIRDRQPAARDLRHHQRRLGLQHHATSEFKSTTQLIQYLVRAAGQQRELSAQHRPDARTARSSRSSWSGCTRWASGCARYGESIYGTRGGPIAPRPWGVTTQKGGKIYVHVLDWTDDVLALPKLANVRSGVVLGSGKTVGIQQVEGGTLLRLPTGRDPVDTVIVLN